MGEQKTGGGNWFQKYIVPGIVFQSCVIAGGYGTGRELIEYFMGYGPVKGTMAICIITLIMWSLVSALTYCFAVVYKKFDYKSIMKELMGPGWIVYEISYILVIFIILAVITSAAGSILNQLFGFNNWIGIIGLAVLVFLLVINGSDLIEKVLSAWSFILYGVYLLFLILAFVKFGDGIAAGFSGPQPTDVGAGWLKGGFMYSFYNMAVILFYPQIIDEELPIAYMIDQMGMPWLQYVFQIVLFGTLIETGSGLIYSITDRFETAMRVKGKEPAKWFTPVMAIALLALGCIIAQFGLTALIAKGYGAAAWIMFIVYCIPMLTLGTYKIRKRYKEAREAGETI